MVKNLIIMNEEQFKRVKFLLSKSIMSDLDKSESEELDAWRKSSAANEDLFRRLSDKDFLMARYADFRVIREMDGKVAAGRAVHIAKPFIRWAIGIAAALLIFFTGYEIYRGNKEDRDAKILMAQNVPSVLLSIDNSSAIDLSRYNSGDKIKNTGAVKDGNRIVYDNENSGVRNVSMHTLSVPQKQIFSVVLPDGSKVWLDSKSKITYPTVFSADSRVVRLSGEGYFEVTKNPSRPFIVMADGVKIKVTGTRFNLKAYSGDKKISAVLMDGKISLSYHDKSGAEKEIPMHSGELSVLDRGSRVVETSEVNSSLYNSWIDGIYFFDSENLEDIMNGLGRYYGLDVVFVNAKLKEKVLSGKLHMEDNAETMLESFKKILPGHIKLEKKTIIIF